MRIQEALAVGERDLDHRRGSLLVRNGKGGRRREIGMSFHRFSDALKENINARVWGGIHLRTGDLQGARLGKKVARYLHNHYLQPVD